VPKTTGRILLGTTPGLHDAIQAYERTNDDSSHGTPTGIEDAHDGLGSDQAERLLDHLVRDGVVLLVEANVGFFLDETARVVSAGTGCSGSGRSDFRSSSSASVTRFSKQKILKPRIDRASVLVVLITPDTANSWWVNWEIEYAAKQGKHIVGVCAQGATLETQRRQGR